MAEAAPRWRSTSSAPPARARRIALDNGLRYACTGNVHDPAGQGTRCHHWYRPGSWGLTSDGRCAAGDTPLPGLFDGPPGTWRPKRLPVRIVNQ